MTAPVCGLTVGPSAALAGSGGKVDGTRHFFGAARCKEQLVGQPAPAPRPAAGARYICPMCEGVESPEPADCPTCGMALEPALVTLEDAPSPELAVMSRRFWV